MPSPPPRSSATMLSASCGWSATICRSSATTRCAATSNPDGSKICEPMCECSPISRSPGSATTRRTASAASPPASEKPNFWSSCAVAMNSWVCASTPTVTRTITGIASPAGRCSASPASRAISSNESMTIAPIPASTAVVSSAERLVGAVQRDPLGRESGAQREPQLAAGADVQRQPLVVQPAHDLGAQERLSGVVHAVGAAEGVGEILAAAAEVGLVDDHQRGAVLLGEVADVDAGQAQRAGAVAGRAARPDVPGPAGSGRPARPAPAGRCAARRTAGPAGCALTSAPGR